MAKERVTIEFDYTAYRMSQSFGWDGTPVSTTAANTALSLNDCNI
ncbi:conserved hypothetical protein [Vibrio nigripulchritudo ENn2]|nr:conserved hypothetical protein [Vibrio nigripulchritudo ENn2]